MTGRLLIAVMLGYSVGSLPNDTVAWAAVRIVFALGLLVLLVKAAHREAGS